MVCPVVAFRKIIVVWWSAGKFLFGWNGIFQTAFVCEAV
ncbi:hypothetical protein l11_01350 [Neisseria weaveri LMG 5135]|nr:hypothetical protein l13_06240 [Neisseria weaveri ATCC 51223]EGV38688.1 hypothetical protein l11_01350 [Neisseria weaveri LMG 5135]